MRKFTIFSVKKTFIAAFTYVIIYVLKYKFKRYFN